MAGNVYASDTPDEVKNAKGIHLITFNTGNGQAVQILLEELAETYGFEWSTTILNIMVKEQKKDWYLRLNPNGRIPALVDNTRSPPFAMHESSAQMMYLQNLVDRENRFDFQDEVQHADVLQWLFFWHGSGAPYQGQIKYFEKQAPEKVPFAIARFKDETLRVFGVLEIRLSGKYTGETRDYLAGNGKGTYSIADMKTWPWVNAWEKVSGFTKEQMEVFPHLLKWVDRIAQRPAVQKGSGPGYNKPTVPAS